MKKILVPTDFSKPAQIAVDTARDIALKTGAQLILLHVVEDVAGGSYNVEGEVNFDGDAEDRLFTLKLIEKSRKQLEKQASDPKLSGIKIKTLLRLGTPFHGMQTIITEQKVDLVVMGTSGRTQIEEMVIGSNTEKIVRLSHCPVLTVQKKPSNSDFKSIVYATSLNKDEEVFSRVVRNTQELYNATIHLVYVNTPGNFQREVVVRKYMQDFAKRLQLKNFTINVFSDRTEEEGIIYFAEQVDADLITMATHGRTGFAHVLSGSIAEDVVSHAKRPVLTFVIKHRKKGK
ncbi:MAG TPA: universal stress protein [Cyclobacteriaceae bacterium]|nr:universal stress protein [Cyclobacteriaceae bacterium]